MSPASSFSIQQALALALQHHHAGRFAEAEALYRKILVAEPGHAEALHLLGLIAHEFGRHTLAIELIQRAVTVDPGNAAMRCNLGEIYRVAGQWDEALLVLQRAVELDPNSSETHNNLGNVLRNLNRLPEAEPALRRAVQLKPNDPKPASNLGVVLAEMGRLEDAIQLFNRSLQLNPAQPQTLNNLGNALKHRGALNEALAVFERALQLDPNAPEIQNNYGTTLIEQGRFDEAEVVFHRVLELDPNHAKAQNNLGNTFKDRGYWDMSIPAYRRALEMKPDYQEAQSNLIYTLHFHPRQDSTEIAAEQRRWNRQFGDPLKGAVPPYRNDRDPARRLRIGYVSPDFWGHVVGRNLLPLFRHHDQSQFETVCYSGVLRPDYFTDEFQRNADLWRTTVGISDEILAETIRQDAVDILVDLSQHMAGNRLSLFARRPAPVQVSFAGYPESAGLDSIPYRISDRHLESEIDGRPAERVFLLDSFWCYDPGPIDVPVNALPAEQLGRVTLGCLNSFCKVNEPLLRLWARVLKALPGSRLLLLAASGSPRERTAAFLEKEGIGLERVEFVERCAHNLFLELHHRVDIALDPFPYNGHTTSLDALWMGVPVVTLAGEQPVSRAGLSQLSNLGLAEFIAFTEDDYVATVSRLARELPRLAELRRALRPRMQSSVIMNAARFTSGIENAFRLMWRRWCRSSH